MGYINKLKMAINRKGRMPKSGIAARWMINSLGIVMLLLVVSVASLSFAVRSSVYNSVRQALIGRSDELINVFSSSSGYETPEEFEAVSRTYIEAFPDKNEMEIMSITTNGEVQLTSTGFAPDSSWPMPDYDIAMDSGDDFGYWTGRLETGEKAMAISRIVRNTAGDVMGSIRYIVSMDKADKQIMSANLGLISIGIVITIFIAFSGVYFVRSIIKPINQLSSTAKKISDGDFGVRIYKERDDELGQLIDTINDMAGELGTNEKLKNDFISSISHELRTPLTAIKGWAETIHSGDTDKETFDKGMVVIIKESERLSGLVEELLDFSRIQSGRMKLIKQKVDVLAELDEAVFMFTDRANTEGKTLDYDMTEMLPPVIADVNRLRQVFVNIIDNALKYTDKGGRVEVKALEKCGDVKVIVSDNGCGIPSEHLPNIKKKFYKANQLVRGSGIGLAVADEIMRLHGGSLIVESAENVGTTVTISIPTAAKLKKSLESTQVEGVKH
jgi:signal transduction histidine kinase